MFVIVCMTVSNLSFIKRGGIRGLFCRYKMIEGLTSMFWLATTDFFFFQGFYSTNLSRKRLSH